MSLTGKARMHLTKCKGLEIPFLQVHCNSDKSLSMPQGQTPYIYFVLDGELRLYTPGGIMDYVAGQYSVSAIDTPERGYVLAFSEHQDFLSASVEFTANDVMNVIISLDDALTAQILADNLSDEMKSRETGIDISFAIYDENGLPGVYRRYGDALVLFDNIGTIENR